MALESICGVISAGAAFDCDNPPAAGVKADILLINKSDVSTITLGTDNVVTAIALKSGGKQAFKFEGTVSNAGPTANPSYELDSSGAFPGYKHSLEVRILNKSQAVKAQIDKLTKGQYIAIVETNETTAEPFVVFGRSQGVTATAIVRNYNEGENGGTALVTLSTPDTTKEPLMPATWLDTDYATTDALVTALLTPTA